MKRPSDKELVTKVMQDMSDEEIAQLFVDCFTKEELIDIALEKLSNATITGIAEDEWSAMCAAETDAIEARRWANGWYS